VTAFAIRRIVEQLEQDGRDGAIVVCPFCEGGSRKRRTLSINRRDGIWLWLCHRGSCPTKGALATTGGSLPGSYKAPFKPKIMEWPLRFPELGDPIADRVVAKIGDGLRGFSEYHDLRVHAADPSTHVWGLRDVRGYRRARISRDESKRVMTWREREGPVYGWFQPRHDTGTPSFTMIVEDCLSAALIAESSVNGLALCGTGLSHELARELAAVPERLGQRVFVALDPDEAGQSGSRRALERLRNVGIMASQWNLTTDVKDMSTKDRRWMLDTMDTWSKSV
jgi:hypothetical protein